MQEPTRVREAAVEGTEEEVELPPFEEVQKQQDELFEEQAAEQRSEPSPSEAEAQLEESEVTSAPEEEAEAETPAEETGEEGSPFFHDEDLDLTFRSAEDMLPWVKHSQQHLKTLEQEASGLRRTVRQQQEQLQQRDKDYKELLDSQKPEYSDVDQETYDAYKQRESQYQPVDTERTAQIAEQHANQANDAMFRSWATAYHPELTEGEQQQMYDRVVSMVQNNDPAVGQFVQTDELGFIRFRGKEGLDNLYKTTHPDKYAAQNGKRARTQQRKATEESMKTASQQAPSSTRKTGNAATQPVPKPHEALQKYGAESPQFKKSFDYWIGKEPPTSPKPTG